jgi:hypothetical protein
MEATKKVGKASESLVLTGLGGYLTFLVFIQKE